jgi:hypothetical protein
MILLVRADESGDGLARACDGLPCLMVLPFRVCKIAKSTTTIGLERFWPLPVFGDLQACHIGTKPLHIVVASGLPTEFSGSVLYF